MATEKTQEKTAAAIVDVLLTDIEVDHDWNGRSGDWAADSGASDATNDFKELKTSIEHNGQLTPVILRPIPKSKRFFLVAGFRRYEAKRQLANGDAKATIRAEVQDLSEVAARKVNLIENTERQNLKPADLCWTVGQYVATAKKAGAKLTQTELAGVVGTTQAYVNYMVQIIENLPADMFAQWRAAVKSIPYPQVLKIAKIKDKEEQKKAWDAVINPPKAAAAGESGKGGKVEKFCNKARDLGFRLGVLHHAELLDMSDFHFNVTTVEVLFDLPLDDKEEHKLKQEEIDRISNALKEGFESGNRDKAARAAE